MKKILKIIEQLKQEIESASLHHDIDELVDAFHEFEEVVSNYTEDFDDDE